MRKIPLPRISEGVLRFVHTPNGRVLMDRKTCEPATPKNNQLFDVTNLPIRFRKIWKLGNAAKIEMVFHGENGNSRFDFDYDTRIPLAQMNCKAQFTPVTALEAYTRSHRRSVD